MQEVLTLIQDAIILSQHKRENTIIGVSGFVASWKTWLCNNLKNKLADENHKNIFYFPFDYWINYKNLDSKKYLDKFYIEEFELAIRNISENKDWFLPRYDLFKKGRHKGIKLWSQCVVWNNRALYNIVGNLEDTNGNQNYYCKDLDAIFTFQSAKKGVYIIEGTMIFSNEKIKQLYDIRLMVQSSWEERVARIFRRYNIQETFWGNVQSEIEFVNFLSAEAFDCADSEILNQMDEGVVLYQNSLRSLSALLDLLYLQEKIDSIKALNKGKSIPLFYTSPEQVENMIKEYITSLKTLWTKDKLQKEIEFLNENRHFIKLKGIDRIISCLRANY